MKKIEKFFLLFIAPIFALSSAWGQPIVLQQITDAYVNGSPTPAYTGGVQQIIWPHPALADIDDDGDFDLFVGYGSGKIMLFRNTGDVYHHQFALETTNYGSINVGSSATPAFYDIDNDGDLDLFVGNGADGGYGGNVAYFENVGDSINAFWLLRDDSLAHLDAYVYDHAAPTIGDIDCDGDGDMIVGGGYGKLHYSENIGTLDSAVWATPITYYANINVSFKATPHLTDLDCDAKPDLLIGNDRGKMFYYKNMGVNNGAVTWQKITDTLTGVDFTHLDYTSSAAADLDGDGDKDILESEHYGNVNLFMNVGDSCNFIPNWVTGDLLSGTLDVGQDAFPAFVDIDGDCDLDMFLGKANGQIRFYRNNGTDSEPNWELVTENFLGFDTGINLTGLRRSAPFFSDPDRDNDEDLAIAVWGSNPVTIWLYENEGDSFGLASVNQGPSLGGYFFMAADFNKDSLVDLAYTVHGNPDDLIIIVRNSGLSTSWSLSNADTIYVGQILGATASDYECDGDLDLFIEKSGDGDILLYRNLSMAGSTIWNAESLSSIIPITSLFNCTWVDVDNNFTLDVFEGFPNGGIKFWKNTISWSKFDYQADELTVAFQDSSFSGATEWFWNFGDSTTSTEQNPVHDYAAPGKYDVCLTIKNGCKESKVCRTVTVCAAPTAGFSFQQDELSVSFQNTSSWADSITWTWDFGDSTISNDANSTHTYAANGTYTVCLIAQNDCGADTLCLAVSAVVGTDFPQKPEWAPTIFPNPSFGRVVIDWRNTSTKAATLTIYNQFGRQIRHMKKGVEAQMIWDGFDATGSTVSTGVYLLQFNLDGMVWSEIVFIANK